MLEAIKKLENLTRWTGCTVYCPEAKIIFSLLSTEIKNLVWRWENNQRGCSNESDVLDQSKNLALLIEHQLLASVTEERKKWLDLNAPKMIGPQYGSHTWKIELLALVAVYDMFKIIRSFWISRKHNSKFDNEDWAWVNHLLKKLIKHKVMISWQDRLHPSSSKERRKLAKAEFQTKLNEIRQQLEMANA